MPRKIPCSVCGTPRHKGRGMRANPICRDCRAQTRAEQRCIICGQPRKRNANLYCSKQCQGRSQQTYRDCAQCGTTFPRTNERRLYCSHKCVRDAAKAKGPRVWKWRCLVKITPCPQCGTLFSTGKSPNKRFCSRDCANRYCSRDWYARHGDDAIAQAHERRARLMAAWVENVTPVTVYERDKWTCHICGGKVRRTARWKRDPEMASLDHLVPLALGGEHSYANVACAHLRCNLSKGTRAVGEQLALIG